MTQLLLALAMAVPAQQSPSLAVPYKEKDANRYSVAIDITDQGTSVKVDMYATMSITKKTDGGFEGTFGWSDLYVDGNQQPDESFGTTLKADGTLKSVTSDYGDGMRRMLLPFYLSYPGKAVAKDAGWTYKDASEDERDAHKATMEYKVVGSEKIKDMDATKVHVTLTEAGPDPMKVDGHYWVGKDGKVLKFDLKLTAWPVPVAGQSFDATIKAELAN